MEEIKNEEIEEIVPMELQSGWETFKNLPNRLVTLIWKIIGWKGVMVGLTVVLIITGKIANEAAAYIWAFVFLLILFGREGLKWIEKLKR
jgi:hypothetical protein